LEAAITAAFYKLAFWGTTLLHPVVARPLSIALRLMQWQRLPLKTRLKPAAKSM